MGAPVVKETEGQEVEWRGDVGTFTTGSLEQSLSGMSHEEILKLFGHDPEQVEIIGVLYERHRQYWSTDLEKMLWKHSYSFGIAKKRPVSPVEGLTPLELVKTLGLSSKPAKTDSSGAISSFGLVWADWQTGKDEGGGTEAFLERFDRCLVEAKDRIKELRKIGRALNQLVIIGGGDMVEGCFIYPNQSFGIDMNRREQIRLTVAVILKGIYELAPMFESAKIVVVPGNHGEHRINGKRTTIGDNDDLLVFEMAQVAIEQDKNMSHVSFEIAENEESIVSEVQGWKFGVTHGSVYGRGAGAIRQKVFNWFRNMAANRHPVGMADVLFTHHFHHDACEDWGETLWVQSPALDGGSAYFRELTGHNAKSGMLSWVTTPSNRFQDKQILGWSSTESR